MSKWSTVLTCLGAAGVVATTIMAVKATPKAMLLIEEAEKKKGEELTKAEIVKTAAPAYIPTAVTGVSTIACIFGANILNKRTQASLMSAYALLDSSYKSYREKVDELYGEGSDERIGREMASDEYKKNELELAEGEQLFFDMATMKFFTAPMEEVIQKTVMEGGNECYIIDTPVEFMM